MTESAFFFSLLLCGVGAFAWALATFDRRLPVALVWLGAGVFGIGVFIALWGLS